MNSIYQDDPDETDDAGKPHRPGDGQTGESAEQVQAASRSAGEGGTGPGMGHEPSFTGHVADVPRVQVEPLEVTEIFSNPLPMPANFQNLAAVGGSVGALLLGLWSIIGAILTPLAMINAIIGILMGFWGLTSTRKKMAIVGITLCLVGLSLSLWEVNGIISNYFNRSGEM